MKINSELFKCSYIFEKQAIKSFTSFFSSKKNDEKIAHLYNLRSVSQRGHDVGCNDAILFYFPTEKMTLKKSDGSKIESRKVDSKFDPLKENINGGEITHSSSQSIQVPDDVIKKVVQLAKQSEKLKLAIRSLESEAKEVQKELDVELNLLFKNNILDIKKV